MKRKRHALLLIIAVVANTHTARAADYSAGIKLGSLGGGVSVSFLHDIQLRDQDQLQSRFEIAVSTDDPVPDRTFAGTEYRSDQSGNDWSARAVLDWYPFAERNGFFISAGLGYSESRFMADANDTVSYDIGNQSVMPSDNVVTTLEIEQENRLWTFLGVGWGNRLGNRQRWSLLAEFGIVLMGGKGNVTLTVDDPDNLVSDADSDLEKRQIENQLDRVGGHASLGVFYHF